jgi:hypothetical protein
LEVDFVLVSGRQIWAIEVKSGLPGKLTGMTAFRKKYPSAKSFIIGSGGLDFSEFFSNPALKWFA